jgi:hypothetical protein
MSNDDTLRGHIILIVQRIWTIASALATEFEGKGAQAVLAKDSHPEIGTRIRAGPVRCQTSPIANGNCPRVDGPVLPGGPYVFEGTAEWLWVVESLVLLEPLGRR